MDRRGVAGFEITFNWQECFFHDRKNTTTARPGFGGRSTADVLGPVDEAAPGARRRLRRLDMRGFREQAGNAQARAKSLQLEGADPNVYLGRRLG
jgi:hypothetical protein